MYFKKFFTILTIFLSYAGVSMAEAEAEDKKKGGFNPGELILHHIADEHEWHITTFGHTHITLPLPIILYNTTKGSLDFFLSSRFHNASHSYNGYKEEHGHIIAEDGSPVYDLSITKNVFFMLLASGLLCWIFISTANQYKRAPNQAPKGLQSFLEPIILFVVDEIAKPVIGEKKYTKFLPYLLTVFFFIWIINLFGLMPTGPNVTGNISVTIALAIFTFIITNINGNKNYWSHIFLPPGMPVALYPIMWVVEILGIFTKPFALLIRLFANITAGHIIILSLISLIFIFGSMSAVAGYGVSIISVAFATFLFFLELLVAALQAYIFTMLSAVFFSQAVEEHH